MDGVVKELREIYPRGKFGKIVCDLNKLDSIEPAFSGIRNLDILVNNALELGWKGILLMPNWKNY